MWSSYSALSNRPTSSEAFNPCMRLSFYDYESIHLIAVSCTYVLRKNLSCSLCFFFVWKTDFAPRRRKYTLEQLSPCSAIPSKIWMRLRSHNEAAGTGTIFCFREKLYMERHCCYQPRYYGYIAVPISLLGKVGNWSMTHLSLICVIILMLF